jgi:mannosyltransferase OCH1-like enzyme
MIPKIIHHIWIGNKSFPEEFKEFRYKWIDMYPDYNFIFWNEKLVESSKLIDESIFKYYYSDCKIALKSDLLRFKILEKFGGIYIDTDTEPLKKMGDEFLNDEFFSGIQKPYSQIAIGMMGSEPNNKLVKEYNTSVLYNIEDNIKQNGKLTDELWKITGPQFFDEICNKYKELNGYRFYESDYFYPYGWNELERRYENFKETCPHAYSVHHWAHSWW